jgi:hypothetical protein
MNRTKVEVALVIGTPAIQSDFRVLLEPRWEGLKGVGYVGGGRGELLCVARSEF